jgi:DNA-binding PadR family transcriptional regulator
VRDAILSLLAEEPATGYGLIRTIAERTDGTWTPSPGSVYPTLQQLVDEGLIEGTPDETGRVEYRLTGTGATYVEQRADELARAWQGAQAQSAAGGELRSAMHALMGAAHQVQLTGTPDQIAVAVERVDEARRALYRLLAE